MATFNSYFDMTRGYPSSARGKDFTSDTEVSDSNLDAFIDFTESKVTEHLGPESNAREVVPPFTIVQLVRL
jgi:hypothetical protein